MVRFFIAFNSQTSEVEEHDKIVLYLLYIVRNKDIGQGTRWVVVHNSIRIDYLFRTSPDK